MSNVLSLEQATFVAELHVGGKGVLFAIVTRGDGTPLRVPNAPVHYRNNVWEYPRLGSKKSPVLCPFGTPSEVVGFKEPFYLDNRCNDTVVYQATPEIFQHHKYGFDRSRFVTGECLTREEADREFRNHEHWSAFPAKELPDWAVRLYTRGTVTVRKLNQVHPEHWPKAGIGDKPYSRDWLADTHHEVLARLGCTWESNPWLWWYEFEKVEAPGTGINLLASTK